MPVTPKTVGVIVKDMPFTLSFYRAIGLPIVGLHLIPGNALFDDWRRREKENRVH